MNVVGSGTITPTVGSTSQLYTSTSQNTYMLFVDTTNMVAGDALELSIGIPYKSGGSAIQTHYSIFAHAQADPGKTSVPIPAPYGATFNLKQTAGTARSFDWCVVTL